MLFSFALILTNSNQPATATALIKKEFALTNNKSVVILDNTLCRSTKYTIIMSKSASNKVTVISTAQTSNDLTVDTLNSESIVTYIHPFQTCILSANQNVTVLVETPEELTIENRTSSQVTLLGFDK